MKKNELSKKLDEFINEKKYEEYSSNTLEYYKSNIKKFINWIPDDVEISKDLTMQYKEHLYNQIPKPKTSSINTWIIELNKFLKWLGLNEMTLKKFKQQYKSSNDYNLTLAEYKKLLRHSKAKGQMDLYYIMKILAMTGIRVSELKYFTVESLESNYIEVYNKSKERAIIVRNDLKRELKHYCRDNKITSGIIFKTDRRVIWQKMKNICIPAKVNKTKVHPHAFRHLFAELFLDEYSDNITELADILGHNSLETTRVYTRSSNLKKKERLEKIKF